MKRLGTLFYIVFSTSFAFSQDSQATIEGIRCPKGELFVTNDLRLNVSDNTTSFFQYSENSVILIPKNYNVYIEAYNPLNYSLNNSIKIKSDPVDASITHWLDGLQLASPKETMLDTVSSGLKKNKNGGAEVQGEDETQFVDLTWIMKEIKEDHSIKCLKLMQELINLSFEKKDDTEALLDKIAMELAQIIGKYEAIDKRLKKVLFLYEIENEKKEPAKLFQSEWIREYLEADVLEKIQKAKTEQLKRVSNLKGVLTSIRTIVNEWESKEFGGKWFFLIDHNPESESKELSSGKVHELQISIDKHQAFLEGEEIKKSSVTTKTITLILKKFDRFIPEISAGTIYTWQKETTYVTARDASGNTIISETEQRPLERFELDVMLNLNLYIPESRVLPFIQLGVATNRDVPMGLFGGGLRMKLSEKHVIAISTGFSVTGIKELTDLNLGDQVLDEKTLQDDLEYKLSPIKPYFGIQYNF